MLEIEWDLIFKLFYFVICLFQGHTDCVNCLRFSPDGKLIASGGADGLVKVSIN